MMKSETDGSPHPQRTTSGDARMPVADLPPVGGAIEAQSVAETDELWDAYVRAVGTLPKRELPDELKSLYEDTAKAIAEDLRRSRWHVEYDNTYQIGRAHV